MSKSWRGVAVTDAPDGNVDSNTIKAEQNIMVFWQAKV
jgi:hypothetical protein